MSSDILERKRFITLPNHCDVINEVARAFGMDEYLLKERCRKDNTARKAAIYFVQRYSGLSKEEIGKIFGGIHFSAVSKVDDRKLSELIRKINSSFKG